MVSRCRALTSTSASFWWLANDPITYAFSLVREAETDELAMNHGEFPVTRLGFRGGRVFFAQRVVEPPALAGPEIITVNGSAISYCALMASLRLRPRPVPRACYGPAPKAAMAQWGMRQVNATK